MAIIDWSTRAVLSWRLSNTMDAIFCVDALDEALPRYGTPEIFNTDQGSPVHQRRLHRRARTPGRASRMDGRGRWLDNVFVERLWRSLKYEDIYLQGYDDGPRREPASALFDFFNERRPHQALGYRVPLAVWREAHRQRRRLWT